MLLHRLLGYLRRKELRSIITKLKEALDAGDSSQMQIDSTQNKVEKVTGSLAMELLSCMYVFICVIQHPNKVPGSHQMAKTHIDATL